MERNKKLGWGDGTTHNLALPAGGIRRPHPRLIIWGRGCGNAWSLAAMGRPEKFQAFRILIRKTDTVSVAVETKNLDDIVSPRTPLKEIKLNSTRIFLFATISFIVCGCASIDPVTNLENFNRALERKVVDLALAHPNLKPIRAAYHTILALYCEHNLPGADIDTEPLDLSGLPRDGIESTHKNKIGREKYGYDEIYTLKMKSSLSKSVLMNYVVAKNKSDLEWRLIDAWKSDRRSKERVQLMQANTYLKPKKSFDEQDERSREKIREQIQNDR